MGSIPTRTTKLFTPLDTIFHQWYHNYMITFNQKSLALLLNGAWRPHDFLLKKVFRPQGRFFICATQVSEMKIYIFISEPRSKYGVAKYWNSNTSHPRKIPSKIFRARAFSEVFVPGLQKIF